MFGVGAARRIRETAAASSPPALCVYGGGSTKRLQAAQFLSSVRPDQRRPESTHTTHTYEHTRTHARTHARTHTHTHTHTHARTYARTRVRTHARTHAQGSLSLFITCAADGTTRTARTRPGAVGENAPAESSARSTASASPPVAQLLAAAIPFLYLKTPRTRVFLPSEVKARERWTADIVQGAGTS